MCRARQLNCDSGDGSVWVIVVSPCTGARNYPDGVDGAPSAELGVLAMPCDPRTFPQAKRPSQFPGGTPMLLNRRRMMQGAAALAFPGLHRTAFAQDQPPVPILFAHGDISAAPTWRT